MGCDSKRQKERAFLNYGGEREIDVLAYYKPYFLGSEKLLLVGGSGKHRLQTGDFVSRRGLRPPTGEHFLHLYSRPQTGDHFLV